MEKYNLIGIGIGPFNLSLAALMEPIQDIKSLFLDQKKQFSWHDEIMFGDSNMQTSYLKDLATPVDPTNPNTFLNYLSHKGLLYQFLNAGRQTIRREEFQDYCLWCSQRMQSNLKFDQCVDEIDFDGEYFNIRANNQVYLSKNICVGTGHVPNTPDCAKEFIGDSVFHIKSPALANLDLNNKKVVIVGGGQSGVEIFRNALNKRWGIPSSVSLLSSRASLRPLEAGPFVDEYFTPGFVNDFHPCTQDSKDALLGEQKYASDGNTPAYLQSLYEELYFSKHYSKDQIDFQILPLRKLQTMEERSGRYVLGLENKLAKTEEFLDADIVILATGFKSALPKSLKALYHRFKMDAMERPIVNADYSLKTDLPENNKVFGMNLSRHSHGIADPQISMMAWRSATIINSLLQKEIYKTNNYVNNFSQYGPISGQEEYYDEIESNWDCRFNLCQCICSS